MVGRVYDLERYRGIAERMGYDQSNPKTRLGKVKYTHDTMIEMIIAEPSISQNELAQRFGYSVGWISRIIGSDSFQAALHKRREEITDPFLIATVEERLRGVAQQSLDIIAEKLEKTKNPDLAIKALEISTKAMGLGARDRGPAVQNNFVVALPEKIASAADWAREHAPSPPAPQIEAKPLSSTISRDPLSQPRPMEVADD